MVDSLEKECCPDFVTEFHAACTSELASTLQSTQGSIKSTCLSYKQIPFEDIGTVKFLLDFNGNVLSAVDEGGICHVCGAGPLEIQSPPKELTLFTQYRRRSVLSEFFYIHQVIQANMVTLHCILCYLHCMTFKVQLHTFSQHKNT